MKKSKINYIFSKLSRIYPNPEPQLNYVNKYTFLIAVVLSAQSTDISVNKVTRNMKPIRTVMSPDSKKGNPIGSARPPAMTDSQG